ncbi:MAG: hypothetical protein ACD_9C00041G0001 [uncultured bacterium]|nr:MAG: hypothetical protein ACD_9C00041G0001 [uncultured bacterium]
MKKGGNICDYKINFETGYKSTLTEIKNSCKDNVKEIIIHDKKNVGEWVDSEYSGERIDSGILYFHDYAVKQFGFVKLRNGFFDNALVTQVLGDTPQMGEDIADQNVIYSKLRTGLLGNKSVSEEDLNSRRNEFAKFISSIRSFTPEESVQKAFENIIGEDAGITAIRKYYWLISSGNLQNAYEMYANKEGVTFEKFNEWYKDVFFAKPAEFKKTGENMYEFIVQYQEHNSEPTKYRVTMSVNGDSIETMSSVEILTEEVLFGDMKAYSIRKGDKNYVILEKNGKEEVVDQGDAEYIEDERGQYKNIANVKYFSNIKFSPKGNYLTYTMSGWEWGVDYVYDIGKKENVFNVSGTTSFEFSSNEKKFIACTVSGMASAIGGAIYSVPGFKVEYNVLDGIAEGDYSSVECKQGDNETVEFVLNNNNWEGEGKEDKPANKTIIYSLSQDKIIK